MYNLQSDHAATGHAHTKAFQHTPPAAPATPRYDPYLMIHKGLRSMQAQILVALGRMDSWDDAQTRATLADLREVIRHMEGHVHHEDTFIHTAMEARAPGSTARMEVDHASHRRALADLRTACDRVEAAEGAERDVLARNLYRSFAQFMAEDLEHLHAEETQNNAVLWATHSDAELIALVGRLVASIPPQENAIISRWMVTASTPAERARMLGEARKNVPAGVFAGLLGGIVAHLPAGDREKLERALA